MFSLMEGTENMENKFLAIDKRYFGTGLRSLDLLIVAHIEEFQRNGCECHLSNQQFCEMFGEDINAVKRSIKRLEDIGLVTRQTHYERSSNRSGLDDRGGRKRTLSINQGWVPASGTTGSVHYEPNSTDGSAHSEPNPGRLGSNGEEVRLKNGVGSAHSEPIKDKEKIIKDNVLKAHSEPTISPEEEGGVSGAETASPPTKKAFVSGDGLPGRCIRDLSDSEAREIKDKLNQGIRYLDIESEYGMRRGQIDAKFRERWRAFVVAKVNGRV